ncbi:MAG TPA: hypothetical protein VK249_30930 [Anaerolineales bacterium]|nr:hypothetical protein [Anaerolineales bacterium]
MPPAAVFVLEIPDVVMELKALNTVKDRAEGMTESALITPLEIIVWLAALIMGLTGVVWFANYRDSRMPLALIVVSAVVLLLITFLFPPLWLRVVLDLGLLAGLVWMARRPIQVIELQPTAEIRSV